MKASDVLVSPTPKILIIDVTTTSGNTIQYEFALEDGAEENMQSQMQELDKELKATGVDVAMCCARWSDTTQCMSCRANCDLAFVAMLHCSCDSGMGRGCVVEPSHDIAPGN